MKPSAYINSNKLINPSAFIESEWMQLIFLLSDTQHWMNEMIQQNILQLPSTLAHILEWNYYKSTGIMAPVNSPFL